MVAGTQERTERVLILWLIDVANSGHIPPRADTGSSCFDDCDSRPGDIDRSLEFWVTCLCCSVMLGEYMRMSSM